MSPYDMKEMITRELSLSEIRTLINMLEDYISYIPR